MCVCVYSGVKASFPSTRSSAVKCLKSHDIPCIWPDSYGKYLLFLLQTLRPVLSVFLSRQKKYRHHCGFSELWRSEKTFNRVTGIF